MTIEPKSINYSEFPLFQDVEEDVVKKFLSVGFKFSYPAGSPLISNQELGETFFLVISGLAKAVVQNAANEPMSLTLFRVGDFFGEISVLEKTPRRTAHVVAVTDIDVVTVQKKDCLRLLQQHPALAINLARVLGERLRAMNEWVSAQKVPESSRIARTLLSLAKNGTAHSANGLSLLPNLSLGEWVLFCNASRKAFLKTIDDLRTIGALEWQNQRIVVRDAELLKQYAHRSSAGVHPDPLSILSEHLPG